MSILKFYPTKRKLVYCSRTVPEIEKALAELKRLMEYRIKYAETEEEKEKERNYTGLGFDQQEESVLTPPSTYSKRLAGPPFMTIINCTACH